METNAFGFGLRANAPEGQKRFPISPSLETYSRAVWFNPRDGNPIPTASGAVFIAPDANDWVLYLQK